MDFKWIGSKVDPYYDNPKLKGCFDFYTSFSYSGEEFHIGEFALFKQNRGEFARIGRLLCVFYSNEGSIKYGGIVRWYTWARSLLPKMNLPQIKFDEQNEVVEEMPSSDSLVSLKDIRKKCKVFFASLDEPVYLIKEYGLDPEIYFSCRYRLEHDELVPHFSEKGIKYADRSDYIVSHEFSPSARKLKQKSDVVCVTSDSECSDLEQIRLGKDACIAEKMLTVTTESSPLIKTTPPKTSLTKFMVHKRKPNHTPSISLDSEGSDVEVYVDKIKSPSNPLKTIKLTPKSSEKKLNRPHSSPLKRNSSVKRVLNDSFENHLTSPSGIPIFCYSVVNSNCNDPKNIKINLKLAESQTGMNLKVFPTKLDEEIIQTKSPVKINDLQEIKNLVAFSPNAKAKISGASDAPARYYSDILRQSQHSEQVGSPKTPAKIGLTRRRSSRTVERKSYAEYSSPESSTPKKRVRSESTGSQHSASGKTSCKDRMDTKTATLSKIDEDDDEKQNIKVETRKQASVDHYTSDKIKACSLFANENETVADSSHSRKTPKQKANYHKKYANGGTKYSSQTDKDEDDSSGATSRIKCDVISPKRDGNDYNGKINKNLFKPSLQRQRTTGCPKKATDSEDSHSSSSSEESDEKLPKDIVAGAFCSAKQIEERSTNNDGASCDQSSKKMKMVSNANNNITHMPKRGADNSNNYLQSSCNGNINAKLLLISPRPKRNAGAPVRYTNDDNREISTSRQKHDVNRANKCSDDDDTGGAQIAKSRKSKHNARRFRKGMKSDESDASDNDYGTNNTVSSRPVRSVGRPKRYVNSDKSDDTSNVESPRLVRSVGRPKRCANSDKSDDTSNVESPRPVRSVGRPKRYDNGADSIKNAKSPRLKYSAGTRSRCMSSDKCSDTEDVDTKSARLVHNVSHPKKHSSDKNSRITSAAVKCSVGHPKKYVESDESDSSDCENYMDKKNKSATKNNLPIKTPTKTPYSIKKTSASNLRRSVFKNSCKKLTYEDSGEDDLQQNTPKTPSRGSTMGTPKNVLKDTPTARARMIREGIITPSVQARNKAVIKDNTPLSKARTQLHVSFVPKSLPCREKEFADIINFLEGKLLDGCGGCMYVSGVPGTGKTATVTEVIRNLQESVEKCDLPSFKYINVNGMRLSEPRQSYVEIVKQLMGKTVHWEQAQTLLENRFVKSQKKSEPIILVVDELDILFTKRQDVVYNLLDWPTKANAQLIVITIANTMDLPERLLMGRVTSRLGLTRLTFQAYTHKQLQEIVSKRLLGISAFNPDAIQLVARKVASVSGDARRALDICRRAVEIAELEGKHALVSMVHVNQALNAMITQPKVQAIKRCSRLEKLILQAVVAEVERTGVEETNFSSVLTMLIPIAALDGFQMVSGTIAMAAVSKLGACRLLLTDQKCNNIYQRIILNVSADDVYYALTKTEV